MTTLNAANMPKYRPVLTASQIFHILSLAKLERPLSSLSMEVIATLAPFAAKIENLAISPAYTISPATNTLEALGAILDYPSPSHNSHSIKLDKEAMWQAAYNKKEEQGIEACTLAEISMANEHAYLHDLMSPEEKTIFEQGTDH